MFVNEGTPLSNIGEWKNYTHKLAAQWITTAEQVVGLAATAQGVRSLAQQIDVSEEEMKRLLENARAALPSNIAAQLAKKVDTSKYGLGAVPLDRQD